MIAPRWRKVFRDLWSNKTRTVLVLLSIAVGVAAIGMVMGAQSIVDRSLPAAYAATNPASATIFTINTFGDDLVESIEAMPEISAAEARRSVNVRFLTPEEESYTLQLTAVPDFDEIAINKIKPQEGAFPPEERQFLIERASLVPSVGLDDIEIGDTLEVESPSGKKREIRVCRHCPRYVRSFPPSSPALATDTSPSTPWSGWANPATTTRSSSSWKITATTSTISTMSPKQTRTAHGKQRRGRHLLTRLHAGRTSLPELHRRTVARFWAASEFSPSSSAAS